jgi:hypothetical protein
MASVWATPGRRLWTLPGEEPGNGSDHGAQGVGVGLATVGVLGDELFGWWAALHSHARGEEDRVDPLSRKKRTFWNMYSNE